MLNNRPVVNAADLRTWGPGRTLRVPGADDQRATGHPSTPTGAVISVSNVGNMVVFPRNDRPPGRRLRPRGAQPSGDRLQRQRLHRRAVRLPARRGQQPRRPTSSACSGRTTTRPPSARRVQRRAQRRCVRSPIPFSVVAPERQAHVLRAARAHDRSTTPTTRPTTRPPTAASRRTRTAPTTRDRTVLDFVPPRSTTTTRPAPTPGGCGRRAPRRSASWRAPATPIDPYLIEYDYQPDRIRVWVDGDLHLDAVPADPARPVPARADSRSSTSHRSTSARRPPAPELTFSFVQGRGGELSAEPADGISMPMHDGIDDTHVTRDQLGRRHGHDRRYGHANPGKGWGWFDITGTHVYEQAGTFHGEVCATDQDDLGHVLPVHRRGHERAPGGRRRARSADRRRGHARRHDVPGPRPARHAHRHDRLGRRQPASAGTVEQVLGGGTVSRPRTPTRPTGRRPSSCASPTSAGASACDAARARRDRHQRRARGHDRARVDRARGDDGRGRRSDSPTPTSTTTHTATVDWGDGSAVEAVVLQDGGDFGSGIAAHTYADNGVFAVTFGCATSRRRARTSQHRSPSPTGTGGHPSVVATGDAGHARAAPTPTPASATPTRRRWTGATGQPSVRPRSRLPPVAGAARSRGAHLRRETASSASRCVSRDDDGGAHCRTQQVATTTTCRWRRR